MRFEDTARGLIDLLQRKTTRYTILFSAITISVMLYVYVVDIYDPNKNLVSQLWRSVVNTSYHFYSGSQGGFYVQIGELLENETSRMAGMKILNHETVGGVDNAIRVASTRSAFGLAQEDSIPEGDFILDQVRLITPLYLEHVHILYRRSRVSDLLGIGDADIPEILELFPKSITEFDLGESELFLEKGQIAKDFFESAIVSTGPHRSGSRIIASYLLEEMGAKVRLDLNLGLKAAIDRLVAEEEAEGDGLDIVFWITGGPLEQVTQVLEKYPNIQLMSLNPTLAPSMNQHFGLKLRPATFKDIYVGGENVSTLGSYSFLICSKDVPNFAIMRLLEILDEHKEKIKGTASNKNFQLNQFNSLAFFRQKHHGFLMELARNTLIFITSVTLTTAAVMSFLLWLVSNLKQIVYFREITQIYKTRLPDNTAIEQGIQPFPKPIVDDSQTVPISELVIGTQGLLKVAREVRGAYREGGITSSHQAHILKNINDMIDIFQRNLSQRLSEVISNEQDLPKEFTWKFLRHYHTAGYLKRDEYIFLVREMKSQMADSEGLTNV